MLGARKNKVWDKIVSWRVLLSGSNLNNGANDGLATFNANNDSSNANVNIGSHLCLQRNKEIE